MSGQESDGRNIVWRLAIPKKAEGVAVDLPTQRELATRFMGVLKLVEGIGPVIRNIAESWAAKSTLGVQERKMVVDMVEEAIDAAIEVNRAKLQASFIDDLCEQYDYEELEALVKFHESRVGRQIALKTPTGNQRTGRVWKEVSMLANQLVERKLKTSHELED
jgi:hypothetical protein